jgi:hypothetical protein
MRLAHMKRWGMLTFPVHPLIKTTLFLRMQESETKLEYRTFLW